MNSAIGEKAQIKTEKPLSKISQFQNALEGEAFHLFDGATGVSLRT